MKIVYLYHSIRVKGGLERILADKMNYLAKETIYDIYFITTDQLGHPFSYTLSNRIKHIDIGGIKQFSIYRKPYPMRLWYIYQFEKEYKNKLLSIFKEIDPDFIITNTCVNASIVVNLPIRAKIIIESHLAKKYSLRAGIYNKNQLFFKYIIKKIYDAIYIQKLKKCDLFVTLTKGDAKAWSEMRKLITIPNPLSFFPSKLDKSDNKIIIVAARLAEEKGIDLLIEAWSYIASKYKGWEIHVYGEGIEKEKLKKMIISNHIENSFKLFAPVDNIYEKYAQSEFLVLSSRNEGFGLVLIEEMSCGKPCVSFNCPFGPDEIITDGVDGLIVNNGDVKELANKMAWMIEHDAERREMGLKARETIRQRYSIKIIMEKWIDIFENFPSNGCK